MAKISLYQLKYLAVLAYMVLSYLGETEQFKEYAPICMVLALSFLLFFYVVQKGAAVKFKINSFHVWILMFTIFCFLSARWALSGSIAVSMSMNIVEMAVATILIDICFQNKHSINDLLSIVMFCGYILVFICLIDYGLGNLLSLASGSVRLDNTFMNSNTIGMAAGYSVIINLYFLRIRKIKWWSIMILPALFVMMVSQSKKAFILFFVGVVFLYVIRRKRKKTGRVRLYWLVLLSGVAAVFALIILRLPIFASYYTRFSNMVGVLLKSSDGDWSTFSRIRMIQIGMQVFENSPLLGIGLNNVGLIIAREFGYGILTNVYAHNNYVELLADLGMLGTSIYYFFYLWLLVKLMKNWNREDNESTMAMFILISRLALDVAMVSYLAKTTYIYTLIVYRALNIALAKSSDASNVTEKSTIAAENLQGGSYDITETSGKGRQVCDG